MSIAQVVAQNNILRRELGGKFGFPLYQWKLGKTLEMPMVILDDDGNVIHDYTCKCGRNKRVHQPDCVITEQVPQWEMRKLVDQEMNDCWIYCRWNEPPKEEDWCQTFGGDTPWPKNGYYSPVFAFGGAIHLKAGLLPDGDITDVVIIATKKMLSTTKAQLDQATKDNWANKEKAATSMKIDMVKNAMTASLGYPGKKDPEMGNNGWGPGVGESKIFGGKEETT